MKKSQKKILGLLGLTTVGVVTVVAATMPSPEASAISSVTDTITIRVVSNAPNVDVLEPKDGEITSQANQIIKFNYENVNQIRVTLKRKDQYGNELPPKIFDFTSDGTPGSDSLSLNLADPEYGYGEYTIIISGENGQSLSDEDTMRFTYLPVIVDAEVDQETGDAILDLDYDEENGNIDHFGIVVTDENGNTVVKPSPIIIKTPETEAIIPFSDYDLPAGKYTIATTAYDESGNALYTTYQVFFVYKPVDKEVVPVPDTGGLFQGLNISKSDYLITGLIIFFMVGLAGSVYILKSKTTSNNKRK